MVNINISKKHLLVLIVVLIAATVVNYVIAQGGMQSHPLGEIETVSGSGDYLDDDEDGLVDQDDVERGAFVIQQVGDCGFPPFCPDCNTVCESYGLKCAFTNPLYEVGGIYYSYELESCSWVPAHNYDQCFCWP